MNKKINFFIYYILPVILFGAIILYFSNQSEDVLRSVSFINNYENFDKIEHLFIYALFSLLVYRLFKNTMFKNKSCYLTIVFIALFSLIDETSQLSVITREFSVFDIIFNVLGSFINIFIYYK